MTKNELIDKTLRDINEWLSPNDSGYLEVVIAELQRRLPDGVDIKTCGDFKHLGVECCETCHGTYAHYEMKLIDLPDGGKAWVCHPIEYAIYPERYQAQLERERTTPEGKLLREIFGEMTDEKE